MDDHPVDGPCVDSLILQALLDDEVTPDMVEIVLHHAEACPRCLRELGRLRRLRDAAAATLWLEDEADHEWRAETIARVKTAIDLRARPVPRIFRGWYQPRRSALVAAAVFLVVALLPLNPPEAGASGDRIAWESVLRERAWIARPNTVRHWIIESDIRNRPGMRDGRYRREVWQRNGSRGEWARVSRQHDAFNRLVSASWQREDGSVVIWVADRPDDIVLRPATAILQAALPGLPAELRGALSRQIQRRQQSNTVGSQQVNFAAYLARVSGVGARVGTFERIRSATGQDLYMVRSDVQFPGPGRPVVRLKTEDFIGADDFRRYQVRTWRYFKTGTVETEDARTTYFDETPRNEFDRQTLEDLLSRAGRIIELTPSDLAREQLEQEALAAPTPYIDPDSRKGAQ